MTLTDREKRVVMGVFEELLKMPYSDLNKFLGSCTIADMQVMYAKMVTEDYCKRNEIRFEDLDEFDWENIYRERYGA